MYNVSAILPRGEGIGFSLAGARVLEAGSAAEAAEILEAEMDDDKSGVILVDETYLETIPERLKKKADESTVPLVVGIPVIKKWEYTHDRTEVIEHIIRRAVGYRIKIS